MRVKNSDIVKFVLLAIAAAGVLTVALTAPNVMSAFSYWSKPRKKYNSWQIKRSLKYLNTKNMITMAQEGDKTVVRLTKNGQVKLLKYKLDDLILPRKKSWDGKWRVVAFDVPESYKVRRDAFSFKVKQIGMYRLQKSLWVWPYDCEDEIEFLKEIYEIRPFVRYFLAERMDRQEELLRRFGLSS